MIFQKLSQPSSVKLTLIQMYAKQSSDCLLTVRAETITPFGELQSAIDYDNAHDHIEKLSIFLPKLQT